MGSLQRTYSSGQDHSLDKKDTNEWLLSIRCVPGTLLGMLTRVISAALGSLQSWMFKPPCGEAALVSPRKTPLSAVG